MDTIKRDIVGLLNKKGFVTSEQFAQTANVSIEWVQRLCRYRKIKAEKLNLGNMWLIDKKELKKYLSG